MADQEEKNLAQTIHDISVVANNVRVMDKDSKPFIMLPPGYQKVNVDDTLPKPVRKSGCFTMFDSASFVDYFNKHKGDGSAIFGQVEPPSFVAQLNGHAAGSAGWGDHRVLYSCPVTREWKEWNQESGKAKGQEEFAEFIESHLPDIHGVDKQPTGAEMLEVANNFKATSKSNFASGIRLANGNVDFQYVEETTATAGAKGSIKVPESFFIAIPVFEGGNPYKLEAKLRYRINNGALKLWYELIRPHVTLEDAFKADWAAIEEGAAEKIWRGKPA